MVSTRGHPRAFPPPDLSPTKATSSPAKRATRQTSSTFDDEAGSDSDTALISPSKVQTATAVAVQVRGSGGAGAGRARARSASAWSHVPSPITIAWLLISLPLVLWDTGYVLGRPRTMPGGAWHWPLWVPYELYGTVDHLYGFPAIEQNNGFTGAQGTLNVIETVFYGVYLYYVYTYGIALAGNRKNVFAKRRLVGREAGLAVLFGFAAAIMTLSKTILYWLVLAFAGWEGIKHNDLYSLILLWVIPNGAWIVGAAFMSYDFGASILDAIERAGGLPQKKHI